MSEILTEGFPAVGGFRSISCSLSRQKTHLPPTIFFLTLSIYRFSLYTFLPIFIKLIKILLHYLRPLAKVEPNLLRGYEIVKSNRA